jgi:spermidine synthase
MLGVATVVSQALLLREAMAAMGGSETSWGLVMALWLAGMGLGARTGARVGTAALADRLPSLVLVLCGGGVVLLRAAPALAGAAPGEILTTWPTVGLWTLAVVPAAFAGGLAFPILAAAIGRDGAGRAYALEAVGALAGGVVLSALLAPLGTAAALLVALGAVGGVAAWHRHPALAVALALACAAGAIPASEALAEAGWRWSGRPGALAGHADTRHQRLELAAGPPASLWADGRLAAHYPEPYTTLPRAHLTMLLHPQPRRVLAIGCTADGSLGALLRHPVSELILVEEDPALVPLLRGWYDDDFRRALADPRAVIRTTDPLRAVAAARDLDLVILADGDPTTLRGNRTRTVEFLRACRRALRPDGRLVLRVGVGDTYLGGVAGELLAVISSTVRAVFPRVEALPGEPILLVAGNAGPALVPDVGTLVERRLDRPEIGEELHPVVLSLLVDESRRPELADFVAGADRPPNTLRRPTAAALGARLLEHRSEAGRTGLAARLEGRWRPALGWLLGGAVAALGVVALGGGATSRAVAAAAVVGLTSMGWWLLLLATWQMTRGSVFAEVGALTAAFMAGVAAGGWLGLRAGIPGRALPAILAGGAGLSLAVASGLAVALPAVLVPLLLVAGGCLTGAAFPGLAELAGGDRRGVAAAFAADEIGAGLAALLVGTVALPEVGLGATGCALAGLGLAAVPAVLRR